MPLGKVDTTRYFVCIGAVLVTGFTALRPAGGVNLGLAQVFLHWLLQIGLSMVILISLQVSLQRLAIFDRLNPWLKTAVTGVLGALAFAPVGTLIDYGFGLDPWPTSPGIGALTDLWAQEFQWTVFPMTLFWLAINAPRILQLDFSYGENVVEVQTDKPKSVVQTTLFARLPRRLGYDILYVAAELHYVRVVTHKGNALILYSLSDAISDLQAIKGIQPHRSYWVALNHVVRQTQTELFLTNGNVVPVSRRRVASVQDALQSLET